MPETPAKIPALTVVVCDYPTKERVLELQREYRRKYGENIAQDKISAAAFKVVTVDDLPAPVTREASA